MKRLDFLKSLAAMPLAIKAVLAAKSLPPNPGLPPLPPRLIGKSIKTVRRRLVGDMAMRHDALLDPEIFTSIINHPGEPRVIQFFGRWPEKEDDNTIKIYKDETT